MNLIDLEKASQACHLLKTYREQATAVAQYDVVGISVGDPFHDRGAHDLDLSWRRTGGGGSVSSIGYPKELQAVMTKAFKEWCENRIKEQLGTLRELGVEP